MLYMLDVSPVVASDYLCDSLRQQIVCVRSQFLILHRVRDVEQFKRKLVQGRHFSFVGKSKFSKVCHETINYTSITSVTKQSIRQTFLNAAIFNC